MSRRRCVARVIMRAAVLAVLPASAVSAQWFADVTEDVGFDDYIATSGDGHGPGAVLCDLDGDGFADLYLVEDGANRLYRNVADGAARVFERVETSGAADDGAATGAIAGDYDNDGDLDLYVTNFDEPNVLLRNLVSEIGQLVFVDVTASTDPGPGQHGVGVSYWDGVPLDNSLTAAWCDVDRDGDLDLYVGNHNGWSGNPIEGPFSVPGRRDILYRNDGDGTFTDVTMQRGVTGFVDVDGAYETPNQRFSSSNAVIFADFDNDGWPDLFVTNKIGLPDDRDMLYINRGVNGSGAWLGYELVTYDLVPTFGHRSGAAMGVDVMDADNDGDLDIYITDVSNLDDTSELGQNDLWINRLETGTLSFERSEHLPAKFSWGTQWQDFDLDGRPDLYVGTNNHFRDYLYMDAMGSAVEVAEIAGVDQWGSSRGVLTADYDADGWVDVLVVNLGYGTERSILFRNEMAALHPTRRSIEILLRGDPDAAAPFASSRDALGARLVVHADVDVDGIVDVQRREVRSGSSNAACTSSVALEVGVGEALEATIEIAWPSGRTSVFDIDVGQRMVIDERALRHGDVDGDGDVDVDDFVRVIERFGVCASPCATDLDGNGIVSVDDLLVVLDQWG